MAKAPKALSHRPKRFDRTDFRQLIASMPPTSTSLGLTHVTSGYILREIVDSGKLESANRCPVLNENVTYTFYGRAAFRRDDDSVPSNLIFEMPTVLILDPASVPQPKYTFAFDSGAFMAGMFDHCLNDHMPLFDFSLEPTVLSGARIARNFFGGSEGYLKNQISDFPQIPVHQFEAISYSQLLRAEGRSNRLDDRVSTVEIIFDKSLDLRATVRAAVLPSQIADEPTIGGRLKSLGIRVDEYEWTPGLRPSEYHMLIRSLVEQINRDLGWLT